MKIVPLGLLALLLAGCGSSNLSTIDNGHGKQIQTACVPSGNAINRVATLMQGIQAGTVTDSDAATELQKASGDLATAAQIGTGQLQTDATDAQTAAGRLRVALLGSDSTQIQPQAAAMNKALASLNADCP
jgi:hypothetical protein